MFAPYSWCRTYCCWPSPLTSPESFQGAFHKDTIWGLPETSSLFQEVQQCCFWSAGTTFPPITAVPSLLLSTCTSCLSVLLLHGMKCHPRSSTSVGALPGCCCSLASASLSTILLHWNPPSAKNYWEIWWGNLTPYSLCGGPPSVTIVWQIFF